MHFSPTDYVIYVCFIVWLAFAAPIAWRSIRGKNGTLLKELTDIRKLVEANSLRVDSQRIELSDLYRKLRDPVFLNIIGLKGNSIWAPYFAWRFGYNADARSRMTMLFSNTFGGTVKALENNETFLIWQVLQYVLEMAKHDLLSDEEKVSCTDMLYEALPLTGNRTLHSCILLAAGIPFSGAHLDHNDNLRAAAIDALLGFSEAEEEIDAPDEDGTTLRERLSTIMAEGEGTNMAEALSAALATPVGAEITPAEAVATPDEAQRAAEAERAGQQG